MILDNFRLDGRVALVSGTSRGLGQAAALALAEAGADLALLDRSLQTWLVDYNQHRPNHGHYMAGRTPQEVKKQLRRRIRKTAA